MSVVFVLVFVAIIIASVFLFAFIWSVKDGQYDDTYTPSVRILFDEPIKKGEDARTDQLQSAKGEKPGKPEHRSPDEESDLKGHVTFENIKN